MENRLTDLSRVQCPVCEGDIFASSGQGGTAKERDPDEVEAGDGHEGGGDRLVAAAEGDGGVGEVPLVHDLDTVCDGVPGDEGVPHGLGAVGEAVANKGRFPVCVGQNYLLSLFSSINSVERRWRTKVTYLMTGVPAM